jgi:hypothetical protein
LPHLAVSEKHRSALPPGGYADWAFHPSYRQVSENLYIFLNKANIHSGCPDPLCSWYVVF